VVIGQNAKVLDDKFPVSSACEEAVCRLVRERTGIVIQDHQLKKLHNTLSQACQRYHHPDIESLLKTLSRESDLSSEFEYLIGGITVGESYFFRDEAQIEFLRNIYFPRLIEKRRAVGKKEMRIWSAGCAAGQELYSIAIMLYEILPDIHDWQIHLLGTDINTEALRNAIKGHYNDWSLRATSELQKSRFFRTMGNGFELNTDIRNRVKFAYLNLRDNCYPSILNETCALDLILCRNVFIYLQQPLVYEVMCKFRDCLREEGLLLLGASDMPDISIAELTMHNHGYLYYYQKTPSSTLHMTFVNQDMQTHIDETDIESSNKPGLVAIEKHRQSTIKTDETAVTDIEQAIFEMIKAGKWQAIIDVTEKTGPGSSYRLLQYRAKALANLGSLIEAEECCAEALQQDITDKHIYFIHGLVLLELERFDEAERAFQKTIYLDREHVEAYYQLGLLLIRTDRVKAGIKNLVNAQMLAEKGDQQRLIHDSAGMTYGRFVQILRNEIDMYRELFIPAS
jgi:chemotaxis protein methyltransferase CheR